ncbi:MAG TPA: hypothetical protein VFI65_00875 [Streptosporangiaceae bacterium]|nr:hypothetical protein [Streptosporangiaceae bacterium]
MSPPAPSNMTILMHQLGGDAMFSAATLAVLLVPITGYGVLIRQRERREEEEAAERSQREAAAIDLPPDPLLEFFAPLQPRPAELPSAGGPSASSRFQSRPGLTGRSTLSTPLSGRSAFTPSPQPSGQRERPSQERPALASSATEATAHNPHAIQVGIGSDSVRRAETSGTPPWEPANKPTTELPWAVISASGSARTAGAESSSPSIPPPPDSVWNSAPAPAQRSSAPRSLFEPTPPPPPRSSQPRDADGAPRQAPPPPPQQPQGRQPRLGPMPPPQPRQPREAPPQPPQGRQPRQGPTQPAPGRQPQGGRQTQPRQQQPRQAQPPGQPKRPAAQSRRGGSATPSVPAPAPMPAPVPQPTSWEDLPQSDRGQVFVWNPVSDEFPASDRIGDLPRRNRRGKH